LLDPFPPELEPELVVLDEEFVVVLVEEFVVVLVEELVVVFDVVDPLEFV
jgi:hypothetical protein